MNAVQIGLGTFGTIVQNLAGRPDEWDAVVGWLLESTSETRPEHFRGVAVEPVPEHVERLSRQADGTLPHLRLVQAAVGEEEAEGSEVLVLTQAAYDGLLESVPPHQRKGLAYDLVYLRNMSCVDGPHPTFDDCWRKAWRNYGVDVCLEPLRTDVWSYSRLAESLDFCGCELLLIDAEGHDAQILRSMIRHCQEQEALGHTAWPDVVVFESAGLCDRKEGWAVEEDVRRQLEAYGYFVLVKCKMNTDMVRRSAMETSKRLQRWAHNVTCYSCNASGAWPFTVQSGRTYCCHCSYDSGSYWN